MLRMTKIEEDESSAIPKNEGRIMSEGVDETAVNPQTQKQEFHIAVLMFLFFFLVIAVFQLLKPLKSGLFIVTMIGLGMLGVTAQYLSVLTIGVMLVMVGSGVYAGRHFARVGNDEAKSHPSMVKAPIAQIQAHVPAQLAAG